MLHFIALYVRSLSCDFKYCSVFLFAFGFVRFDDAWAFWEVIVSIPNLLHGVGITTVYSIHNNWLDLVNTTG